MREHPLSRTTHTLDMAQVAQLDERLTGPGAPVVTAGQLEVDDGRLAATAVLTKVWWEGAPEFPYIYGDFATAPGADGPAAHVQLHTAHLLRLSHLLGLHHHWGV